MSKYDLGPDAQILCDAESSYSVPDEDEAEDAGEGLTRHESGARLNAIEFKANLRKDSKPEPVRQPVYDRPTRPLRPLVKKATTEKKGTDMDKTKQGFAAWMLVLYRVAAVCLLVVFALGMILGTRTLLSLSKVINRQVEVTQSTLTDALRSSEPSGFITFEDDDKAQVELTTADIKVGNVAIKFSANEAIIVMLLEYAVGFIAMLLFMNFHKIEVQM